MWDYPDMRQLALHRMLTAQALNIPASTPDGFILDDYIASGELEYPVGDSIELKAWISGNLASLLNERPLSDDQGIEKQDDKQLLLCATVQDTNELRWWLLGFGDQVEVLEPAEFRGYFAEIAANMANAYGTAYDSR
jgi:predicted DNA-binding transcriptional regulator YafY